MSEETPVSVPAWRAVIALKNPTQTVPYLESMVFNVWLGHCVDKVQAEEVFKSLKFNIPERAFIIYEEVNGKSKYLSQAVSGKG